MELVNFQLHRAVQLKVALPCAPPPSAADLGKQLKKKNGWTDGLKGKKTKGERNDILFFKEMNGWNLTVCGQP